MQSIKAIETRYKGYLFRSRLEARWAVFFDALGLRWEYEKEGYDLDGLYYLPDFWLPSLRTWLEIKAIAPDAEDLKKIGRFYKAVSFQPEGQAASFYVLVGQPYACGWDCEYEVGGPFYGKPWAISDGWMWTDCPRCGKVDLALAWPKFARHHDGSVWDGLNCMCCDVGEGPQGDPRVPEAYFSKGTIASPPGTINASPRLVRAYNAARSARFEHGQSGATIGDHPPAWDGQMAAFRASVLALLNKQPGRPVSAGDLQRHALCPDDLRAQFRKLLVRMADQGVIERVSAGVYRLPPSAGGDF